MKKQYLNPQCREKSFRMDYSICDSTRVNWSEGKTEGLDSDDEFYVL